MKSTPEASAKEGPFGAKNKKLKDISESLIYDKGKSKPCLGGTTTVIYDVHKQEVKKAIPKPDRYY